MKVVEEKNTNAKNRIAGLLMFVKLAADTLPKPTLLIVQLLAIEIRKKNYQSPYFHTSFTFESFSFYHDVRKTLCAVE